MSIPPILQKIQGDKNWVKQHFFTFWTKPLFWRSVECTLWDNHTCNFEERECLILTTSLIFLSAKYWIAFYLYSIKNEKSAVSRRVKTVLFGEMHALWKCRYLSNRSCYKHGSHVHVVRIWQDILIWLLLADGNRSCYFNIVYTYSNFRHFNQENMKTLRYLDGR